MALTSISLSYAWFCLLLLLLLLLLLIHQNIILRRNQFFTRQFLLVNVTLKASIKFCTLLHDRCRTLLFWVSVARIKSRYTSQCGDREWRVRVPSTNPCKGLHFRGQGVCSAPATSGPIQTSVWAATIVRLFWKSWLSPFKVGENQLILSL